MSLAQWPGLAEVFRPVTSTVRESAAVLLIVAHPDDEVIGAGAQLRRLPNPWVLCVTDGSPRDLSDAQAAGFKTRADYAKARRSEFLQAAGLAGIGASRASCLEFVDQKASLQLVPLSEIIADAIKEIQPAIILTHPYEGGHPDHDATAFAVHAACRWIAQRGMEPPAIGELTSYHARFSESSLGNGDGAPRHRLHEAGAPSDSESGGLVTSEFLPWAGADEIAFTLSPAEREFKQRLFDCYATQKAVLRWFGIAVEKFRLAPPYDFQRPPHAGRLFYENFSWGMTGARWRELAGQALDALDLTPQLCH